MCLCEPLVVCLPLKALSSLLAAQNALLNDPYRVALDILGMFYDIKGKTLLSVVFLDLDGVNAVQHVGYSIASVHVTITILCV